MIPFYATLRKSFLLLSIKKWISFTKYKKFQQQQFKYFFAIWKTITINAKIYKSKMKKKVIRQLYKNYKDQKHKRINIIKEIEFNSEIIILFNKLYCWKLFYYKRTIMMKFLLSYQFSIYKKVINKWKEIILKSNNHSNTNNLTASIKLSEEPKMSNNKINSSIKKYNNNNNKEIKIIKKAIFQNSQNSLVYKHYIKVKKNDNISVQKATITKIKPYKPPPLISNLSDRIQFRLNKLKELESEYNNKQLNKHH